MKVILLKDVRGVGQHGTIQNVADGYAINKLFPAKLAEPATEEKIKKIEAEAAARAHARAEEERQLENKVQSLRGKRVTLSLRAAPSGGLFKTVSEADVAKAIRLEHSLEIPESAIHFSHPVKAVGEHAVQLKSKEHSVELSLRVNPE